MPAANEKQAQVGVSILINKGDRILLEGKTYPSQTTTDKLGAAIEEKGKETVHKSRL